MTTGTFQKHETPFTDNNQTTDQSKPETIAQRLAHRERFFVEGSPDLSERHVRKENAYRATQGHSSR